MRSSSTSTPRLRLVRTGSDRSSSDSDDFAASPTRPHACVRPGRRGRHLPSEFEDEDTAPTLPCRLPPPPVRFEVPRQLDVRSLGIADPPRMPRTFACGTIEVPALPSDGGAAAETARGARSWQRRVGAAMLIGALALLGAQYLSALL